MDNETLRAEIIALLASKMQKASYEALSEIVGWTPRTVMGELSKRENNRWIVNADDHLPNGYPSELLPDWFRSIRNTMTKRGSLLDWLRRNQSPSYPGITAFLDED